MIWIFLVSLVLLIVCIQALRSNQSSYSRGIYYPESSLERLAGLVMIPLIFLTLLFALATLVEWQMHSSERKVREFVNETYCTEACTRVEVSQPVCITSAETLCQTHEYSFTAENETLTVTGVIHANPFSIVLITENVSQKP